MDVFDSRSMQPMLIGQEGEAFDSAQHIYELKLDGERCIAYLDRAQTVLINKRGLKMLSKVPELSRIHTQVNKRCILDGELVVIKEGKPDFAQIQRRSLMSNPHRIELASKQFPACFTAFDLLYYADRATTSTPLMERKALLDKVIRKESPRLAVSRVVAERGVAFFALVKKQGLEGIVAKQKDSLYYPGERTRRWIKIKNMLDDDFVVIGYIPKSNNMTSIILAQYAEDFQLAYKGHVTLGVAGESFQRIKSMPPRGTPPLDVPPGNEGAVWLDPELVCTVKFLARTANGGIRQPVFKGLREDKRAEQCRTS